jgi:hypothetical protein
VIERKILKINRRNSAMPGSRHIFWNSIGVFILKEVNLQERLIYVR